MIITCNNCSKKFEINSSLIPEKGRLLQCNSCNHQWFFKKEIINKLIRPVKTQKSTELIDSTQTDVSSVDLENPEEKPSMIPEVIENEKNTEEIQTIKLLDKKNKDDLIIEKILIKDNKKINEDNNIKIGSTKKKNKHNILGLTIVFIITFIAIIIVLDTFQNPISKNIPNIEFHLYNLYETINDIVLFFKDLI
tara:strand:+ start:75 stop:656 length:582 start_codon:yes stop_codon:yes gene_type:complete